MRTIEELRRDIDPAIVRAFGAIRRFVITLTDTAIWQVAGVLMPDGQEVVRAEVFGGIGVSARPPSGVQAEAIAAMAGDADSPVIVAVRDEQTRAASAGDLQPDETALYNSKARAVVRADATVSLELVGTPAEDAMLKGTTYRGSEDSYFGALETLVAQIVAFPALATYFAIPSSPQLAALTAWGLEVTAFHLAAPTYLSEVGKVG